MFVTVIDLFHDIFGKLLECLASDAVRIEGDWLSAVSTFADALYDGDLS